MAEAVLLADRIAVLAQGELLAEGTPSALMSQAADARVRELLEAPRRQAERLRERLGGGP
jgi:osmoprotectant transport system ATP-binding protein